jgi:3-hydroxybutyryl-CoA dehydrogenase
MNQQTGQSKFNPTTRPSAVIGASTLGSRIALMLASSGGEVRLYDAKAAQLEIAERFIDYQLPKLVKSRAGAVAGRVVFAETLEPAIADTWMVVEVVPERLDLKKTIFGDLDRLAPQDAILTLVTPRPIASTIPAPSPPMTQGGGGFRKYTPFAKRRSL